MRRVIIESPYKGRLNGTETDYRLQIAKNIRYARRCLRDSLNRGEAPIASHLLYPQVLADTVLRERQMGIEAGLAWQHVADQSIFYTDHGWSEGMILALRRCILEDYNWAPRSLFGVQNIITPRHPLFADEPFASIIKEYFNDPPQARSS